MDLAIKHKPLETYDANSSQTRNILSEEPALNRLKLIITNLIDGYNKDTIFYAAPDQTKEEIAQTKDILCEMVRGAQANNGLEIDLGNNIKFKIENSGNNMVIKQCGDNCLDPDEELLCFSGYQLENLLSALDDNFYRSEHEFTWMANETADVGISPAVNIAVLLNKPGGKERVESQFGPQAKQRFHETDTDVISDRFDKYQHRPYLDPSAKPRKMGSQSLQDEILEFVFAKLGVRIDSSLCPSISFDGFMLYPVIEGEANANHFLEDRGQDNRLAVAPYVVTNRGFFREDHAVLLIVKGDHWMICDPKSGEALGNEVSKDHIKSLGWQKWEDTIHCGFYVLHMIKMLISASMNTALFNPEIKSNRPFGSDLMDVFKEKQITPEEIKKSMRQHNNLAATVEQK